MLLELLVLSNNWGFLAVLGCILWCDLLVPNLLVFD